MLDRKEGGLPNWLGLDNNGIDSFKQEETTQCAFVSLLQILGIQNPLDIFVYFTRRYSTLSVFFSPL